MTEILVDGIGWPEGLRWRDGRLWYSDLFGRRTVSAVTETGAIELILEVPGGPSGLGWLPGGDLLVVSMSDSRILRLGVGSPAPEEHADLSSIVMLANDMTVTPEGVAYVGSNGFRWGEEEPVMSVIVKVDPGGAVELVADELGFPNGMVIGESGRTLVVAESLAGRLSAFDIAHNGRLSKRRTYFEFDDLGWVADLDAALERPAIPDGICIDASGSIWVANPLSAEVVRVGAGGRIIERVELRQPGITCALGGGDGHTLFIATGQMSDQTGASGMIETARVAVPATR